MRYKVAIRFAIDGDLRFISHHDTMRLFERALSRAQLPVKFSEGFNPRPRMSLPLPRAVGMASEADVLVLEFDGPIEPSAVLERLAPQMPGGLTLPDAWAIDEKTLQADLVEYCLPLPDEHVAAVSEAIDRLLHSETWSVDRSDADGKRERRVDIRQYLADASVKDGRLEWTVRVTNSGSLKASELLAAVGLDPQDWHHKVLRTTVHWSKEAAAEPVMETAAALDHA